MLLCGLYFCQNCIRYMFQINCESEKFMTKFAQPLMLMSPFFALMTLTITPTSAQNPIRQTIKSTLNVKYVEGGDSAQSLDLFMPDNGSNDLRPGIVFVHGGGWVGGDKSEFTNRAKELAASGYVAISINYRLAPKNKYPVPLQDCQAAVRWLRARSTEYHIDPNRIASMGSSAGGHLATMLGLTDDPKPDREGQKFSSRTNCVIDYYGRMDLTIEPTSEHHTDFRARFIGAEIVDSDNAVKLYQEASPIMHIDKQSPSILIVHGGIDEQVEPIQSSNMFDQLQKAGIQCYFLKLSGQGHGFNGNGADFAWRSAQAFLDLQFNKPVRQTTIPKY